MVDIDKIFLTFNRVPECLLSYKKEAPYLNNVIVYNKYDNMVDIIFPLIHSPYIWMLRNNNFFTYFLLNHNAIYNKKRTVDHLYNLGLHFDIDFLLRYKIKSVLYEGIYIIDDGSHRISLLLYKNPHLIKIDSIFIDIIEEQTMNARRIKAFNTILENRKIQ